MSPYSCFGIWLFVLHSLPLNTGAISSPVISLAGIHKASNGVMLDRKSAGWYPEPEVLWLDGEGNLLSAGPTETVRGPDDLYTVSSRVTVEKRHSNSFTCRVQQRNIKQTRETHIQVPADFFMVPSCPAVPVTIGLSVFLLSIAAVVFVVFKWRQHKKDSEKKSADEIEGGEKKKNQSNKPLSETLTEIETLFDTLEKGDRKETPKKKLKEKKHKLKNNLQDLHQEIKETKEPGTF